MEKQELGRVHVGATVENLVDLWTRGVPPLIGQIPLEMLDFVVDPRGQKLIGNPEHGGEHVIEMY